MDCSASADAKHDAGIESQGGQRRLRRREKLAGSCAPLPAMGGAGLAGNGAVVQKRDRKSFAILDQVSAEYRGEFFDDALVFNVGGRLPFFKRELHQNCFTTSSAGYVDCIAGDSAAQDAYAAAHPYTYTPGVNGGAPKVTGYAPPQERTLKYHRFLPSASVTYNLASAFQVYASYSKGLQVPSTDNLYQSFYLPQGVQNPKPETTDNFDGGLRYTTSKIQA